MGGNNYKTHCSEHNQWNKFSDGMTCDDQNANGIDQLVAAENEWRATQRRRRSGGGRAAANVQLGR